MERFDLGSWSVLDAAVICDGFGKDKWSEEESETLDAAVLLAMVQYQR